MQPRSVPSFFFLLTACLAVTAAQLRVFRGTLVHSRVRTEMEVLQDHLIGFDDSNLGRVSKGMKDAGNSLITPVVGHCVLNN